MTTAPTTFPLNKQQLATLAKALELREGLREDPVVNSQVLADEFMRRLNLYMSRPGFNRSLVEEGRPLSRVIEAYLADAQGSLVASEFLKWTQELQATVVQVERAAKRESHLSESGPATSAAAGRTNQATEAEPANQAALNAAAMAGMARRQQAEEGGGGNQFTMMGVLAAKLLGVFNKPAGSYENSPWGVNPAMEPSQQIDQAFQRVRRRLKEMEVLPPSTPAEVKAEAKQHVSETFGDIANAMEAKYRQTMAEAKAGTKSRMDAVDEFAEYKKDCRNLAEEIGKSAEAKADPAFAEEIASKSKNLQEAINRMIDSLRQLFDKFFKPAGKTTAAGRAAP